MTDKKWEEVEVTISRGEIADIFSREMHRVSNAAYIVGGKDMAKTIQELLIEFSSSVGAAIFAKAEEEEGEA